MKIKYVNKNNTPIWQNYRTVPILLVLYESQNRNYKSLLRYVKWVLHTYVFHNIINY